MSEPVNEIAPFDSFDRDGEHGPWDDLRDEKKVRYYAEINRQMAELYPEAYTKSGLHWPENIDIPT